MLTVEVRYHCWSEFEDQGMRMTVPSAALLRAVCKEADVRPVVGMSTKERLRLAAAGRKTGGANVKELRVTTKLSTRLVFIPLPPLKEIQLAVQKVFPMAVRSICRELEAATDGPLVQANTLSSITSGPGCPMTIGVRASIIVLPLMSVGVMFAP